MADTLPGKLCHGLAAASSSSPPSPTSTPTGRCGPSVAFSSSSSSLSCCRSALPRHSAFLGNDAIFFRAMGGSNRTKCWGATLRRTKQFQVRSSTISDDGVKWWEKDGGANVMDVHSAQELTDAVKAAEGKLVIVDFFASWCGSCRALYPKICKLAAEHQDIVFLKVNFDENKPLCKSLNVRVLPYFHFYRGADERVDSFSCSITKLQRLKDAIVKHKPGGQAADTGVVFADADNSEPSMTNIIEEEHTAAGSTR